MAKKRRTLILSLLVIVLLALGGFAASLLLLPSEDSIENLIAMDEAEQLAPPSVMPGDAAGLENAKANFEQAVAEENLTYQIAEIYSQSLIAVNDMQEAANVWAAYTEKNPEDLAGWKESARTAQAASAEEQYLAALKEVARLEPNEENLLALSNYQNYKKNYDGQVETLKKLVALTNEQNPKYLLDLADIAALVDDKEAAVAALGSYFNKHARAIEQRYLTAQAAKEQMPTETMPAEGDVAVEMTTQAMVETVKEEVKSEEMADMSPAAGADDGVSLVPPPPPPPPLPAGVEAPEPEQEEIVAEESEVPAEPMQEQEVVVDQPPQTAEPETAEAPAAEPEMAGEEGTSEELAQQPVEPIAAEENVEASNTDEMQAEDAATPMAEENTAPVDAETAEPVEAEMVPEVPQDMTEETMMGEMETQMPALAPAPVEAEATQVVDSREVLKPAYDRLPLYVKLLAELDRKEEALSEAIAHTRDGLAVAYRPEVADILLNYASADATVEYVETISAQAEVAEGLQAVYARALVQQGKYETALPVLKQLSSQGGDYREWYFLALSAAAKNDAEARRDLVDHVRDSFADGDLTEAQKIDRVYALLNAGEKARALDYTERSLHASTDPEAKQKWAELHKALTIKPKPVRTARVEPRVTLDQKLVLARQPNAKESYIRSTAYELLAAGRKDEAVELFSVLALVNGPNSADANQLIYLWGARISGPELGWLVDRAAKAEPNARAGWVRIIADHAANEDVLAIAQIYPEWLGYTVYEQRYVSALTASGDMQALNQYMSAKATQQQSAEAYQQIASRAESVMDVRTAEQALQKAAQADPANRETWLRLTSMYASRARYSAAEQTAANALNTNSGNVSQLEAARQDLAAHFYAGALAKRDGDEDIMRQHYSQVVAIGSQVPLSDRDSQVKYLSAQMALGQEQQASQGFENLLEVYPGDAVLLADYISALLDRGNYLQALDVSARHGADVRMSDEVAMDDPSPMFVRSPSGTPPLLQAMSSGSELKLIFDRPIPDGFSLYPNGQAPSWVSYTTASYDTALVVAKPGYTLQAAETPQGLMVTAQPVGNHTAAEAIRQRYLRLQLLYARLELETDAIDKALGRLESLAPIYQEYPEYRAYQGNAEYYAGNLTRGLNLVKRAQEGDPGNEDIRYLRRNIERFRGEHLKADYEYRKLGDNEMQIATLEARKQYANAWDVTAKYQAAYLDTDPIQNAFAGIESTDANRWQGEFTLARFMDDSSIIEGSIYTNENQLGAGLSYQFVNALGTTNLYGQWHKPYWDTIEAVAEYAVRDRAGLWHLWRPDPKWTLRGELAGNRYSIKDKSNIAQAAAIQGLVLRTLNDKQPYVALAYGLDAEYFIGNVDRNKAGVNNKLLPLRSREIHSLSGIFYHDFTEDTNGELSLGYAVDRLGESGPAVEGRLHHYLAEEVEMQLRARYGLEAGNTDNDALSVGGYVRWTW